VVGGGGEEVCCELHPPSQPDACGLQARHSSLPSLPHPALCPCAASVVYIDSPVGAGFSYVDDPSLLTTNVSQISADLLAWTVEFFATFPQLST
jgi:hypothetical protein